MFTNPFLQNVFSIVLVQPFLNTTILHPGTGTQNAHGTVFATKQLGFTLRWLNLL